MSHPQKIVAKSKGAVCGEKTIDWPDNLKEATKMDGEDRVFSLYSQQKLVQERAALYPKVISGKTVSVKAVYDRMLAAGVDAATATQVSGYTPEAA